MNCTIWSRTRLGTYADLGIGSGDRVAYMLDNSLDLIVLVFSLMIIGSIQIPINTRLRNDSLKFIVSHCKSKLMSWLRIVINPSSRLWSVNSSRTGIIYRHSKYSFQWQNTKDSQSLPS